MNIDIKKIRQDFPILTRLINGKPLVYLDNAATSQKPESVIKAIADYYIHHNANVHRGVHTLSDESTDLYEQARLTISRFLGSQDPEELIFVKNTTEAINLVAYSWAQKHLEAGDEIIVTELEHHSNLIPWQQVCDRKDARLVHAPIDQNGDLAIDQLVSMVGKRTKLVAMTQVSNVAGSVTDVFHIVKAIKKSGVKAKILIDGAQSIPHMPVNVSELNIDFFAFSGHKMLGPMGAGGLWVRRSVLDQMDPFLFGGGMINKVGKTKSTWAELPDRFDAGTPNVAGAVGLAAACDYLKNIGLHNIHAHEQELMTYALEKFQQLESDNVITLYGNRNSKKRAGILTFNLEGIHAHDVAQILDREFGIAIRSGHHCNQVILEKFGCPATARASFYLYNTKEEIDKLVEGLHHARKTFQL